MGTKVLKIIAGAIVMGSGVVLTKIGLDKKVEKKAKAEAEVPEGMDVCEPDVCEPDVCEPDTCEPEKAEKREPRKGGKKWRKAQAEQNK